MLRTLSRRPATASLPRLPPVCRCQRGLAGAAGGGPAPVVHIELVSDTM